MVAVTVTSVDPAIGSTAGGTTVEIVGTGFQGSDGGTGTTVTIGGVSCTSVVVNNDTSITCDTGAHAAGAVNVQVENNDLASGSLLSGYTYVAPPVVTSVSPASGPIAGGTEVVVTGTGFLTGLVAAFDGQAAPVAVWLNSTQIVCITPAGLSAPGAVNVYVQNDASGAGLSGTLVGGYTYVGPPTISSVTPATDVEAGGAALTIAGTGFVTGATVTIGGALATSTAVTSALEITCNAPPGYAGARDVVVTNPDAQSGTLVGGFTYTVAVPVYTKHGTILTQLLPPGSLWHLEGGSELQRTLVAMGDEFQRVEDRGADLIEETDPRTASETLADWERVLSLPDDIVTEIPATTAGRQVAITQKFVTRGGATEADYSVWCAACGYPLLSITRYAGDGLMRIGDRIGDRLYATPFAYAILLTLDTPTAGALTQTQFEAVIRARTHSHIEVMFTY